MVRQDIIGLLQCVECKKGSLLTCDGGGLICEACCVRYDSKNNIPDLRPQKAMRQPKLYDDPQHKKWRKMQASCHDYFYQSGGLIGWVQNFGHRAIRELMQNKNYRNILDLGCGDGAHYSYFNQDEKCFGVDIDQASLEKLMMKHPSYPVFRCDAYQLPLKDQSVDCVVNIYNLEHMIYLDIVLEEIDRVLTQDGEAYLSVPNEGAFAWNVGRKFTSARHFHEMDYSRVIAIEHINCIWQIEKAIKRHFKIKRRIFFPFCIPSFHANLLTTYYCTKA